ncbi:VanZ family protein [Xenophilus arseniciresistens]|uniref:VanZ family protein n=1 Tax=Xenophilus arseniciresistens TaxID=1283306 RepID=A0AAE3N7U3_9BURK|nr:VanZ family protein [Xenophilus arseniciresistens]MDA7415497.1 VanZ family protein [Xenophilus arseniciresistens]
MSRPVPAHPSSVAGLARLWRTPRFWRALFAAALLGVLVLSLMPPSPALPTTGWDKSNHALGFATLAFLGLCAFPGGWRTALILMIGLLAYGAVIEVLQSFTPARMAEWADLWADGMGLLIGWAIHRIVRKAWAPLPG